MSGGLESWAPRSDSGSSTSPRATPRPREEPREFHRKKERTNDGRIYAPRVRYPARWRLTAPSASLRFDVRPRLADQELAVGTRYWEGAVVVQARVSGTGCLELLGY